MTRPLAAVAVLLLASAPAAAQAPLPVDLTLRAVGTDSFTIRIPGRDVGYQHSAFEASTTGWRYVDHTVMTGRVEQTTTVELMREGAMHRVEQRGTGRGLPMATDLTYEGGRVKGRTSNPAADGSVKAFDIDSAVGAVVDDNALQALVPALPLAEGASWSFTMFSSGQNKLVPMTLTVTGRDTVEVPAGRFDAWRVEATGSQATLGFYVTSAAPRRVVRVEVVGAPIEFVLAK
jgi:hypothetical protein